jgi:hypothetical protein
MVNEKAGKKEGRRKVVFGEGLRGGEAEGKPKERK